jgi:hypothetical protein
MRRVPILLAALSACAALLAGCASFYHPTKADESACLAVLVTMPPGVNITRADTKVVLGELPQTISDSALIAARAKLEHAQSIGNENDQVFAIIKIQGICEGVDPGLKMP